MVITASKSNDEKDRLLDYIKELEIRILATGERLPTMREDVAGLFIRE